MNRQEIKEIEKMQNQACGLLNTLQERNLIGDYEAQIYTTGILFDLSPETAKETLNEFILQFEKML
jgi:hypothetical protein